MSGVPTASGKLARRSWPTPHAKHAVRVAPLDGWRRLLRDGLLVTSTGLATDALGAVVSLALRVVLDPAQMGVWQALKLLLSYSNYSNLGISKGAVRELNLAQGRGECEAARRGLDLGFTVNSLGSGLFALLLIATSAAMAAGCLAAHDTATWLSPAAWMQAYALSPWSLGLLAVALLAIVQRHLTYQTAILRCQKRFDLTARQSLLEGGLTLTLVVSLAYFAGLAGLYLGTLAVMLAASGYLRRAGRLRMAWAWNRPEIERLIGIGSPILLSGILAAVFRSLDKLAILHTFADREVQLGNYSLALLVSGQLYGLGNTVSLAVGPRYGELFGKTGSRRAAAQLAARASELQTALVALCAAITLTIAPPLLAWFLPRYQGGLAATVWLVPGTVALVLSLPAQQWLVAVDRQQRFAVVQLLLVLAGAALQWAAAVTMHNLTAVALAAATAYWLQLVTLVGLSFGPELPVADRIRYGLAHLLALVPLGIALAWIGTARWLALSSLAGLLLGIAAVLASGLAVLALGWWVGGWQVYLERESRR